MHIQSYYEVIITFNPDQTRTLSLLEDHIFIHVKKDIWIQLPEQLP